MNEEHGKLFRQIQAFSIDQDDPELTFAARLSRENGWPLYYANRVIDEYKKFIFLAVTSGHPVTPSDQVDQVWHLHLTYTHSYWEQFCQKVLGQAIHHGPTQGGQEESQKFHEWYEHTLECYQNAFEEPPPSDIWPGTSIRFGDDLHFQRVNTQQNWTISKWRFKRLLQKVLIVLAMLAVTIVLIGELMPTVEAEQSAVVFTDATSKTVNHFNALPLLFAEAQKRHSQPPDRFNRTNRNGLPKHIQDDMDQRERERKRKAKKRRDETFWKIFVISVVVVAFIGLLVFVFGFTCPVCHKYQAFYRTGISKEEESETMQEWSCKLCGHTEWKKKPTGGGGCGGGGCGGCGGGGCGGG